MYVYVVFPFHQFNVRAMTLIFLTTVTIFKPTDYQRNLIQLYYIKFISPIYWEFH